jgi:hypothetical protein
MRTVCKSKAALLMYALWVCYGTVKTRAEQTGNEYRGAGCTAQPSPTLSFLNPTTGWMCIALKQYRSRHFVLLEQALMEFDLLTR